MKLIYARKICCQKSFPFGLLLRELTKNLKICQNSARLEISPPHRRNCRVLLDHNLSNATQITFYTSSLTWFQPLIILSCCSLCLKSNSIFFSTTCWLSYSVPLLPLKKGGPQVFTACSMLTRILLLSCSPVLFLVCFYFLVINRWLVEFLRSSNNAPLALLANKEGRSLGCTSTTSPRSLLLLLSLLEP